MTDNSKRVWVWEPGCPRVDGGRGPQEHKRIRGNNMNKNRDVDIRQYQSGMIRLRFKMSGSATKIVDKAFSLTGYRYRHSALEAICLEYLSTDVPKLPNLSFICRGKNRVIIKLYPNQLEIFNEVFDEIKKKTKNDTDSLVVLSKWFLNYAAKFYTSGITHSPNKKIFSAGQ